ncbi:helix-turn-helix domain-containing protein, partial [Arsenophonus nasoniae]
DLTSPAGKMTMQVISAVAEFERDLLIERTQAGIVRAKAQGKKLGRPRALNDEQREEVLSYLKNGQSISSLAKIFNTTRQTIMRIRDAEFATAKSGIPA